MNSKIAFCINGLPDNNIIKYSALLSKLNCHVDFFVFLWDTIDNNTKIHVQNMLNPKSIIFHKPINFPFDAIHKEPDKQGSKNNSISMFYGISYVQQMRLDYERRYKFKYDVVIRCRHDLYFFDNIVNIVRKNKSQLINAVCFPWEHHHIGLCDQFWMSSSDVMNIFCDLFEWIKTNITNLYFVNENILFQFMFNKKISFYCDDIKYIILREHLLDRNFNILWQEYCSNLKCSWHAACKEKNISLFKQFITNKCLSACNIYFLSNKQYNDIYCYIYNISNNAYIYISNENYFTGISCSMSHKSLLKIHPHDSSYFNIMVHENNISLDPLYLTIDKFKLICSNDGFCQNSLFFLLGNKNNCQISNSLTTPLHNTSSLLSGNLITMDNFCNIVTNCNNNNLSSQWCIVVK